MNTIRKSSEKNRDWGRFYLPRSNPFSKQCQAFNFKIVNFEGELGEVRVES